MSQLSLHCQSREKTFDTFSGHLKELARQYGLIDSSSSKSVVFVTHFRNRGRIHQQSIHLVQNLVQVYVLARILHLDKILLSWYSSTPTKQDLIQVSNLKTS